MLVFRQGAERKDPAGDHGTDQAAEAQQAVWGHLLQENQQSQEARWGAAFTHVRAQEQTRIYNLTNLTFGHTHQNPLPRLLHPQKICFCFLLCLLLFSVSIALFSFPCENTTGDILSEGDLWSCGLLCVCRHDRSEVFWLSEPLRQTHSETLPLSSLHTEKQEHACLPWGARAASSVSFCFCTYRERAR